MNPLHSSSIQTALLPDPRLKLDTALDIKILAK